MKTSYLGSADLKLKMAPLACGQISLHSAVNVL